MSIGQMSPKASPEINLRSHMASTNGNVQIAAEGRFQIAALIKLIIR
jgi:hypothetical protein